MRVKVRRHVMNVCQSNWRPIHHYKIQMSKGKQNTLKCWGMRLWNRCLIVIHWITPDNPLKVSVQAAEGPFLFVDRFADICLESNRTELRFAPLLGVLSYKNPSRTLLFACYWVHFPEFTPDIPYRLLLSGNKIFARSFGSYSASGPLRMLR